MLTLDASKTALVVIDLQEGILPFAGGPHTADDVVSRAARLAIADDVLVNDGTLAGLDDKVAALDRLYRGLAGG